MKKYVSFKLLVLVIAAVFALQLVTIAQETTQLQVTSSFDSIAITEIKAVGNLETGSVEVSMHVRSDYHKLAGISFTGGAFNDFGLIDDKGVKYKYSSYSGSAGLDNGVNKGYLPVTNLRLGISKVGLIISVHDTLHAGQSSILAFRLPKVDKTVKTIKEVHMLGMLQLNYMAAGQKECYIKNITVEWVKPKLKQRPNSKV
jgi:hypothetical protein